MTPEPREEWHFDTRHIGRRVLVFDELESTNTTAMSLANGESFAILALNQTAGRGRFGRVWRSRPGAAMLLSVALHPPAELRRPSILTVWAAVAVADAVERLTQAVGPAVPAIDRFVIGEERPAQPALPTIKPAVPAIDRFVFGEVRPAQPALPTIKWPNDLLVNGQKICGILIEQCAATVVGIGLNLNQTKEEFEAQGLPLAASLGSLTGSTIDLRTATEAVIDRLDFHHEQLLEGREQLETEWKRRTGLLGEWVEVEHSDGTRIVGRLLDMTFDGLDLELPNGSRVRLVPETVEHVRSRS